MRRDLKTTRPVRPVRTIDDVIAIEAHPYDELVTAHNLYDLFLATAQHVGDRKALTVLRSENPDDVGVSLTHGGLLKAVTRAANLFHGLGIRPDRGVVVFLAPNLPQLPALLLGAQVAGTASTINYLLTRDAIIDLLNAQGATVLVIPDKSLDDTCWSKAEGILDHVRSLRHVLVIGDEPAGAPGYRGVDAALGGCREDALDFEPTSDRNSVCALFHTGGTTGRPKLVQLTHGNQIHAAFGFAQVFGYDENDTVINVFPFFHVGGTITVGLSVLAAGGHMVVPGPYGIRPPAVVAGYWKIVQRFGATVVGGVPTSIAAITNSWDPATDVKRVRMSVTGGAVCPKAVTSRFEDVTGIRMFETYGMTETAAAIAFNPGRGTPVAGSVGFRAPYAETRIVSLDDGKPGQLCGLNETGLVQVRGPQVFPGYLDPAHNAGTLAPDGWLTTGDVGYLTEDARLVLTGREKDLIIRSGHNIDPATIEDVANKFAGVEISAAVGMPDQYAGEVPALFVVPRPGARLDTDAVARYVEANIHEPPARPRTVLAIDALPVTAVGKIFKPALRDLAIKEKVRQEVAAICSPAARAEVDVRLGDRKQTLVDITLSGAEPAQLERLAEALRPLPQTYAFKAAAPTLPTMVTASAADPVTLAVQDNIATLTLNRPDKLNAASRELMQSMAAQVQAVARLPAVRAVIIAGSGRAFSAGGDLIEFGAALEADPATLLADVRFNQDVFRQIEALPVPVIGAANGLAVAGGLELLLCCDIILAAEGVKMGDGHARYGVVPAGGATVRLGERISPSHAAQLFYTAGIVDAGTLSAWGLVNEVLPADKLLPRAMELAREICRCSPEAVRAIKSLTAPSPERNRRLEAELERFAEHVRGSDLAKGLAAFRAKTPVQY
jgi:acyl-CoA synthetase (AMP-forming)/AMP-acid ligase II/enoyl-CoA hydratase/carnithine racemase